MNLVYRLAYFLPLGILASGCVTNSYRDTSIESTTEIVELTTTPYFPQSRYQCGPASLATVLKASGLNIDPDKLAGDVYLPDRKGTLQIEMVAAVRRYGRVPYETGQDLQSIIDQLKHDQPVLVLLNLGFRFFPIYHYAVVIGYKPDSDTLILRSGMNYRLLMSRQRFLSAWHKSGSWALTVLQPGKLPAAVNVERYLKSIIALESVGQWRAAELGYRAVLRQWPTNTLALFGLANTLVVQGKLDKAVAQYRNVLKQNASHKPARNNLADTLLQLNRCEEASTVLEKVMLDGDSESAVDKAIKKTRSEIQTVCAYPRLLH